MADETTNTAPDLLTVAAHASDALQAANGAQEIANNAASTAADAASTAKDAASTAKDAASKAASALSGLGALTARVEDAIEQWFALEKTAAETEGSDIIAALRADIAALKQRLHW